MRLAVAKGGAAITPIENVANSAIWMNSAAHCSSLLQATADAAELLVRAVIERRGLPADRSHDVAELAAEFGAQRPGETELVERIAALNGASRRHHVEMYRFRPPDVSNVKAAVRRLLGTLDLWASVVETGDDDMVGQQAGLARMAARQGVSWSDRACAPVRPKSDEAGPAQAAGEAALADRSALTDAIALFRDRMRRVLDGPVLRGPGEPGQHPRSANTSFTVGVLTTGPIGTRTVRHRTAAATGMGAEHVEFRRSSRTPDRPCPGRTWRGHGRKDVGTAAVREREFGTRQRRIPGTGRPESAWEVAANNGGTRLHAASPLHTLPASLTHGFGSPVCRLHTSRTSMSPGISSTTG